MDDDSDSDNIKVYKVHKVISKVATIIIVIVVLFSSSSSFILVVILIDS